MWLAMNYRVPNSKSAYIFVVVEMDLLMVNKVFHAHAVVRYPSSQRILKVFGSRKTGVP